MVAPACNLTEAQVNDVFLAAPPAIAKEMFNLSLRVPNFVLDLPRYKEFPTGQGTQMQQLIYRGEMPAIERGFAAWNDLSNNTGCDPCAGPNCGYNWTTFGGPGIVTGKQLDIRDGWVLINRNGSRPKMTMTMG